MISRIALVFLPMFALAQDHVPPYVDQELRARVTSFYENFVEGSYSPRKAEPFVAEDTKEFFYNAGKQTYHSFKIEKITYTDDYTKAVVVVVGSMERVIAAQKVMMDVPQDTHWKLENGKWCWTYHSEDYPLTPMGGKNPPRGAGAVVPKNTSPEAMRAAGTQVLEQQAMGLDKSTVTIDVGKPSSTEVVFTNGAEGEIQIALDGPVVRGLTAKLDKMNVPGHGTAVLTLRYDPSDKSGPKDVWEPKGSIPFRVVAAPFNRMFPVDVVFIATK